MELRTRCKTCIPRRRGWALIGKKRKDVAPTNARKKGKAKVDRKVLEIPLGNQEVAAHGPKKGGG